MDDEQMDGPMAAFLQEMEEMRNNTAQIEADIQKVKKAQNEILTTPSVDAKTKQELEDAMNNIKKRANVVRTKLKATEKQVWPLSQFLSIYFSWKKIMDLPGGKNEWPFIWENTVLFCTSLLLLPRLGHGPTESSS